MGEVEDLVVPVATTPSSTSNEETEDHLLPSGLATEELQLALNKVSLK